MSEAIELYKRDGTPAGIFSCSECGSVFPTNRQAQWCHGERRCECGELLDIFFHSHCQKCANEIWWRQCEEKERASFAAAEKITRSEYQGKMVFSRSKFYVSVQEALEALAAGETLEYVWACENIGLPQAKTCWVTEDILDSMWDGVEEDDLIGVDELGKAIEAFNAANSDIEVWKPNLSLAILVGESA